MDLKKVSKLGNSIGVRFNGTLATAVSGIKEGDSVNITYKKDEIIIKKSKQEAKSEN